MGRVRQVLTALGFILLLLCVVAPGIFTPYDPLATDPHLALAPPSAAHPLGTDQTGSDIWARVVYGASSTVLTGLGAVAVAFVLGVALGAGLAVVPRVVREAGMRVIDALMALPEFLLALLLLAFFGSSPVAVIAAVALAMAPGYARIMLYSAEAKRASEAYTAAQFNGVGVLRRNWRYVLMPALQPLFSLFTIGIGTAILIVSGLTFLGLGVQPPTPDWGVMLSQGRSYVARSWWPVLWPGLALLLTIMLFTFTGRRLQRREVLSNDGG
ncbi:ABC transporter permease [Canibacter zhoujuaniae]|uniref:ABC transporter permease n=1 Tax=Canibacter zhoujuaniae TaxID=2708343 RepID=UPI00142091F7|nr:ABC transporter permease [Canibacter zhoujuaniae]